MGIFDRLAGRRDDEATRRALEHVQRGNALQHADRPQDGLREYLEAIQLDPKCADAQYGLGRCYHSLAQAENERAGGIIYFRAGLDNLSRAIAAFEETVRLQPSAADTHLNLGLAYDHASRLEDAERSYRRAISLDPDGMDGADGHFNLALLLYMRARGWAGLKQFPAYSVSNFGDPTLQQAFAEAEKAIALGERICQRDPSFLPNLILAHRRTAKWYSDYVQGEKAIEHYRAILRLNPQDTEAQEWLAKAERIRSVEKPSTESPQSQGGPPEQPDSSTQKIHFHCPHCSKKLNAPSDVAGKTAKCPGCARQLRIPSARQEQRQPAVAQVHNPASSQQWDARKLPGDDFLALLSNEEKRAVTDLSPIVYQVIIEYKKSGNLPNIIGVEERKIELLKRLPTEDLERLAKCVQLCAKGTQLAESNPSESAKLYREAIALNPYDALSLMSYGCLLGMQGNLGEGITWVEKALEVDPGHQQARNNLRAMKEALSRR